jgi:hypothetical protein
MTRYCTLGFAKSEKDITGLSKTLEDAQIFTYIAAVSQRIDGMLQPNKKLAQRPFFAPYIESRSLQIRAHKVNTMNMTIDLNMYLLALASVLAGAQDVSSKIIAYPAGFPPFNKLQINVDTCETWYTLETSPTIRRAWPNPLTITGTWGWHADWDNAFVATSIMVTAGINDTVTEFNVTATEGVLFSPGNTILLDSEYMEVTGVSTDTLTVIRAVNGSTKAAHLVNAPVSILSIPDDIQRATARQVSGLYARRGAFSVQTLTQLGLVQYPQDLLLELENTIASYRM